jgi:hypothetical protein
MNTTTKDHIHCDDTVFAVETKDDGTRQVHIFGYGYCADSCQEEGKDCRFVEYTFCYVPLNEVLARGLRECEDEYGPEVKQYITDCTFEEMMNIYEHYDNGQCPTVITAINANIPDGTYVLVSKEVK